MIKGFSVESKCGEYRIKIVVNPGTSLTLYRHPSSQVIKGEVVNFSPGENLRLKVKGRWVISEITKITDTSISMKVESGPVIHFSFYDFQKIYFQD